MPDVLSIAVGVGAGLLFAEAIRSWAVDASWRFASWRTRRLQERVRREWNARSESR